MSRTTARIATIALLATPLLALAAPAAAQQAAPQAQAATPRTPASAEARAAYDRADPLSRSVFWTEQAEINPLDPIAGVKAAQAMRELGRYQEAADMAERVLLVQPGNVEAMLEVGRGHIARGQAFYGVSALERARDANPRDWRAWSLLGTAYEQVRRSQDAQAARACARQSGCADQYGHLGDDAGRHHHSRTAAAPRRRPAGRLAEGAAQPGHGAGPERQDGRSRADDAPRPAAGRR